MPRPTCTCTCTCTCVTVSRVTTIQCSHSPAMSEMAEVTAHAGDAPTPQHLGTRWHVCNGLVRLPDAPCPVELTPPQTLRLRAGHRSPHAACRARTTLDPPRTHELCLPTGLRCSIAPSSHQTRSAHSRPYAHTQTLWTAVPTHQVRHRAYRPSLRWARAHAQIALTPPPPSPICDMPPSLF